MKLPKALNRIRIWADLHHIQYKYGADILDEPTMYKLYFHIAPWHTIIISGSEQDRTVIYHEEYSAYHEWVSPFDAIKRLKEAIRRGT